MTYNILFQSNISFLEILKVVPNQATFGTRGETIISGRGILEREIPSKDNSPF